MQTMDPQQELAFIRRVIQDSRQALMDNGLDYIVWGLLVSLGMFASIAFDLLKMPGTAHLILWILVMGGGWVFSLIRHLRERSFERARSVGSSLLGTLWLACGIAIMVLIFIGGPLRQVNPSPAIAAVLGIGYLVSGVLLDFPYFRISAVCWWLGSAAMFYLESPWAGPKGYGLQIDMLLFALMMVLFQVVPGVILYRRWKRELGEP